MSIKISKIRNYIKGTYERFGEIYYAYYWNLGYLSCLLDEKKVTAIEHAGLTGYCDRLHFVEQMKIINRKVQIEKEESKKMKLEEIKKRIDESIKSILERNPDVVYTRITDDIINEAHKALEIYKELITEIDEIYHESETPYTDDCQIIKYIKKLEEKYYLQPRLKTTKGKLTDIINEHFGVTHITDLREAKHALIKLRDEIPEWPESCPV